MLWKIAIKRNLDEEIQLFKTELRDDYFLSLSPLNEQMLVF